MIRAFDDYCIHQTPDYVRVPATTDRNFYDRYFFNGYRSDGSLAFGAAFGRYPNRFVQDAHFTFAVDGIQRSLHASDVLSGDPAEAVVGPVRVEVVEPIEQQPGREPLDFSHECTARRKAPPDRCRSVALRPDRHDAWRRIPPPQPLVLWTATHPVARTRRPHGSSARRPRGTTARSSRRTPRAAEPARTRARSRG